jgi:8-oxo-dGTP diphosphatase
MKKEEKILFNAVVSLLVDGDEVLLALKTKKIGEGCRNGYGGGIEDGESSAEAAQRELEEESGIKIPKTHFKKVAIVDFHNQKSDGSIFICKVHFFIVKVKKTEIKPIETETMIDPLFFKKNELPFYQMMSADREFFPLILNGKKIIAEAYYGPYQKELLKDVIIREVDYLDEN